MCVRVNVRQCACVRAFLCVGGGRVFRCVKAYVYVYMNVYVNMYVHVYTNAYVNVYTYVYINAYVNVTCAYQQISNSYATPCVCVYVCVCVRLCVCVRVWACVSVRYDIGGLRCTYKHMNIHNVCMYLYAFYIHIHCIWVRWRSRRHAGFLQWQSARS